MVLQIVANEIREGCFDEYVAAAREFAADASANDAGCLGMSVWAEPGKTGRVVIASRWESEEAMAASESFLRHKAKLKPAFLGNETTIWHSEV